MLATTPSGSWPMRSRHAGVGEDRLVAQCARSTCGEEEVDPAEQAVQLVARLRDRLADLARSASARASRARRRRAARKRAMHGPALGERRRRPAPAARRGPRRLGGDARGVIAGSIGDRAPVAGCRSSDAVGLAFARPSGMSAWRAVMARSCAARGAGGGEEVVEQRAGRRACPRRRGGTRDATAPPPCTAAPGRRIASIMPSSGQRASTTKPGAEVLDAPGGGRC